jgi:pyridoxal phosphate enzyme (YggS family)
MIPKPDRGVSLCDRFTDIIQRINSAAARAQRVPGEITLVAISKTHPAGRIREAITCGITDVGENRLQEAEAKIQEVGRSAARWHLVGHLQANKARKAVRLFDVIHSLDSVDLAQRLNRLCEEERRDELPVLLQVNLGEEETKSGVAERDVDDVVREVQQCERLKLIGLMSVPPYFDDPQQVRPFFRRLRELRDDLSTRKVFADRRGELSMGMTHDFEVAIEEGATIVRIGTAIFGERP